MKRLFQKASIVVFVLFLTLPLAVMILGQRQTVSMQEKRRLAPLPARPASLKDLESLPSEFERFFNDHFGFRDLLLRLNNYFKIFVLQTSPISKVVIGRDGWLYFNFNKMIDDYLGLTGYKESELNEVFNVFCYRVEVCRYFGSRYLFVMAPNKQSIYPEHLPLYIRYSPGVTKADQLIARMQDLNIVPFWDLRPVLREAKKKYPVLYLSKDSHWNQHGAYLAYQSIIGKLQKWYPHLPVLTYNRLSVRDGLSNRGNLAEMIGAKEIMPEETSFLRVKTPKATDEIQLAQFLKKFDNRYPVKYRRPMAKYNPDGLLNVVLFRDSFSTDMIPYFEESFRKLVAFYEPFNPDLLNDLVVHGNFHPDLVIDEQVEHSFKKEE